MEFTITWNEDDLLRLFEDHEYLRRKNSSLIWKSKPTPSVGILCPRKDLDEIILERVQAEGFIPAEGASVTWRTRKSLSAQIKVIGNPNKIPEPRPTPAPSESETSPAPSMEFHSSLFPPNADLEGLKTAAKAEADLLRHPITGEVVGTTKDRKTMIGEEPAEGEPNATKKKSPVSRRGRRKKS